MFDQGRKKLFEKKKKKKNTTQKEPHRLYNYCFTKNAGLQVIYV